MMNKRKNVLLCLLLSAAMISTVLFGCGKQEIEEVGQTIVEEIENEETAVEPEEETQTKEVVEETPKEDEPETTAFDGFQPVITDHVLAVYRDDSYSFQAESDYETISLDEETAKAYPALSKALDDYSEELLGQQQLNFDLLRENDMDLADEDIDATWYLSEDSAIKIMRSDSRYFSFVQSGSSYYGGAHGSYGEYGKTFEVASGKEVALSDIIQDRNGLKSALKEELLKNYEEDYFYDLDSSLDFYFSEEDPYEILWYMTPDGIMVFFNPYDIAPYAVGEIMAFIGYADYSDIFASDIRPDGAFVAKIDPMETAMIDPDRDGQMEQIDFSCEYSDYGEMSNFVISYNGTSLTLDDVYAYSADGLWLHTQSGENYLYLFFSGENDYRWTVIVGLNNGSVTRNGTFSGGVMSGFYENETRIAEDGTEIEVSTFYHYPIASASRMTLATHLDALSTYEGIKTYTPDADGVPYSEDAYYLVINDFTLKTTRDLPVVALNPDDLSEAEDTLLTAGSEIKFYATDGESYVIFTVENGETDPKYIKINYSRNEDFEYIIGDYNIYDCFEELYYAG